MAGLSMGRLIRHAALRGPVWLYDGSQVTLKAVRPRDKRARIRFADGRERTIPLAEIAHVDEFPRSCTSGDAA